MSPLGRRLRLELPDALCALRSRNYRIFFAAQAVSMSGVWMHRVAIGWLVFRLTESSNALGIMDFCAAFPIILFTAVAGAIVERLDLRKTMIVCQTGCAVVACVTAFLAFTDLATFRLLVILTLLRGVIDSFEMPTRYALVSFLVDRKEDLPNAVALNSTVFNVARMIGPSIAGFVIHAAGEAVCFLLNGAAYSSMIAAMKKIRLEKPPVCRNGREKATPLRDAAEGIRQVRRSAPARYLLFMIMLTGFFAFPSIVLMPAMARAVLHGTSKTLGFLSADGGRRRRFGGVAGDGGAEVAARPRQGLFKNVRDLRRGGFTVRPGALRFFGRRSGRPDRLYNGRLYHSL